MMITQFLKELFLQMIAFYLYRWFIYLLHELGHMATAKFLGYKCRIKIRHSRLFMPRCSVVIRGNIKKTCWQDIAFSISGILVSQLVTLCLIGIFYEYKCMVIIWTAHIPILFSDMIPLNGTDGEWILKDFTSLFQWKKETVHKGKKMMIVTAFLVLLGSAVININILFQDVKTIEQFWISALVIFIFITTTTESLWKNAKEVWNRCKVCAGQ